MNRKGQVEMDRTVGLFIAIAVLVVIALGIFYFVQQGRTIGENVYSNVQVATTACNQVADEVSRESFCNQIRQIGKDKYVTCDYGIVNEGFIIDASGIIAGPCNEITQNNRIVAQVADRSLKGSALVNGKSAGEYVSIPIS